MTRKNNSHLISRNTTTGVEKWTDCIHTTLFFYMGVTIIDWCPYPGQCPYKLSKLLYQWTLSEVITYVVINSYSLTEGMPVSVHPVCLIPPLSPKGSCFSARVSITDLLYLLWGVPRSKIMSQEQGSCYNLLVRFAMFFSFCFILPSWKILTSGCCNFNSQSFEVFNWVLLMFVSSLCKWLLRFP